MYDDIKKNKMKTGVVVFIFLTMITLIIYYICHAFGYSEYSIFIALIFSIISTVATYYNCDKVVLASVKARPATREEDLQLTNILEGLMITSGLTSKPRLYVVESNQPNAFATGRNPENAVICVTTGLLNKLDYYELEGVVAHELAHIKNYDIRLSAVVSVMVGFVIMLSDMFTRIAFRAHRSNDDDDNRGNAILMIIGLIFLIISPIVSKLIQLAVSRRREYLADATAISFTRNPDGLISALRKISSDDSEMKVASDSNAHMYIVTPFKDKRKVDKSSIFSTHPGIEERIEALKNLS
ncbi:MAG: M48 family metallopeptidase [Clostridia bacterium]|nr:M48 family metallopeptidase [Clostridia bacterium]